MWIMHLRNIIIYFVLVCLLSVALDGQLTDKQRRRFLRILLFPRGSSLQLVYCLTIPTVNMPNIFVVGVTGSLAWELPYNPTEPYRKRAELLHRRIDKPVSGKRPSQDIGFPPSNHRYNFYPAGSSNGYTTMIKYPINSTYGQWSNMAQYHTSNKYMPVHQFYLNNKARWQATRNKMKYSYYRRMYPEDDLNTHDDTRSDYDHPIYNEFHRKSRRDLYGKIEKFLETIRMNGNACVLKMICRISRVRDGGGTFMEEVMKRLFRNKRSYYGEKPDHYDHAATHRQNCDTEYPECESV